MSYDPAAHDSTLAPFLLPYTTNELLNNPCRWNWHHAASAFRCKMVWTANRLDGWKGKRPLIQRSTSCQMELRIKKYVKIVLKYFLCNTDLPSDFIMSLRSYLIEHVFPDATACCPFGRWLVLGVSALQIWKSPSLETILPNPFPHCLGQTDLPGSLSVF